ncbi:MAG: cell division protein SepF [Peptoniphilaceae bacterium]|nr:cell division protein SepF [Peptoniphilaceae bacterium]
MGLLDKMKNMIGIEDQYDEDAYPDDYEYNNDYSYNEPSYDSYDSNESSASTKYESHAEVKQESAYSAPRTSRLSNVVEMSSSSRMRISIQEPLEYDDGPKVIDNIAQSRTVVLNLEMLEPDKKRQIFDFVSGGVYALNGNIQKVTKDIYVIVPKGVDVDAAMKETASDSSLYQL